MRIKLQKFNNSLFLFWHNLIDFFEDFFSYLATKIYFGLILFINIFTWFVVYRIFQLVPGGGEIVLHYNVDFGINLIGSAKNIYIIPATGTIILILNLILAYIVRNNYNDKYFNRHLLMSSTLVLNLLLLIAGISLYIVNLNQ